MPGSSYCQQLTVDRKCYNSGTKTCYIAELRSVLKRLTNISIRDTINMPKMLTVDRLQATI